MKKIERNIIIDRKDIIQFFISLLALVIAIGSLCIALQANNISVQSKDIANNANEHIEIIEKSTLRVGNFKFTDKTISMHLINGYYSRYPAYVTSLAIDNEKTEIRNTGETGLLIERDEPKEIKINMSDYLIDKTDGPYEISFEIKYVDLTEMDYKSIYSTNLINISNHNIISFKPNKIHDITISSLEIN